MDKNFYTYIILTENNTLYCGYTDAPNARFEKHKTGVAAKYTKANRPIKMVFLKEFETKSEAMKEECRIKKLTRPQKLSLIDSDENLLISNNLSNFP
jgi:putative endonuclease